MNKRRMGFEKLVSVIGKDFFEQHEETACFAYGDTEQGLFCFLGIDLHPKDTLMLSADIEEWDIYATCYVTDTEIIMDKCKLPKQTTVS